MSWIVVGVGAATAALGAYQASENRRAQKSAIERQNHDNLRIAQAQAEYSPWTGIKPQNTTMNAVPAGQSDFGGAVQGGIGGAMFGQGIKQNQAELEKLKAEEDLAKIRAMGGGGSNPWAGNSRGPMGGGTVVG